MEFIRRTQSCIPGPAAVLAAPRAANGDAAGVILMYLAQGLAIRKYSGEVDFEKFWPNHLQEEVIKNWRLYGFEEPPEVKRQKESFQFL
jgi:hypothetical protein